ncbi:MAG: hypothetical protein U0835_21955 [Isosphaeraceae bacterium]
MSGAEEAGLRRPGRGWKGWAVRACPFVWVARARGRWKVVLLLVECLTAAACGLMLWRTLCLWGIPDVPPPVPVATTPSAYPTLDQLPNGNVYALFAQTLSEYARKPTKAAVAGVTLNFRTVRPADADTRRWLAENREVLDAFYQESGQADARSEVKPTPAARSQVGFDRLFSVLRVVGWLAVQQAAVAEADGDLDAAWRSYRAVLRAARHVGGRGGMGGHQIAVTLRGFVTPRLLRWARLPSNTAERLRGAMKDVQDLDLIPADDAQGVAQGYEICARQVESPGGPFGHSGGDGYYWVYGLPIPGEFGRWTTRTDRFLRREPERSRRILRLAFANWLAWSRLAPGERPTPSAAVVATFGGATQRVEFYDFPESLSVAPEARVLTASELARAYSSAREAALLSGWIWTQVVGEARRERRDQAALVISLAEALYQIEKGSPPPSLDALVGPYLKALPDDGSAHVDDESVPVTRVEFHR